MTKHLHSITPPPELVQQWRKSGPADAAANNAYELHIAIQAARWGADQELLACCEWLRNDGLFETRIGHLRAARRPKPPSLKEQALKALTAINSNFHVHEPDANIIRAALEALDD